MVTLAPAPPVAVLGAATAWTLDCLHLARGLPADRPTPCAGWLLGDLLAHLDDSLVALGEAAATGRLAVEDPARAAPVGDPADRVARRAVLTRAAWGARVSSAPLAVGDLALGRDTLLLVGALEVAVHGWDVAGACGPARPLPADLAGRLLPVAAAVVTPGERSGRFAAALPTRPADPVSTRLLAHLGRRG